MLAWQSPLIRFAISHRGVVVALAVLLLGYGINSFLGAKYDVFPEFSPPEIGIRDEAPGLAPEQVELLVTRPLEVAINGMGDVDALRSTSIQGLSVVTVVFRPGTNIYRARQLVTERLSAAGAELPAGVAPPVMMPLTSSASTVLVVGLTSETHSLMDVWAEAEWTLKRRLLAADGIAKVTLFGGEVPSLQVQFHPDVLVRLDLGVEDVLAAARQATGVVGNGFVETTNQRVLLQAAPPAPTPASVAATVIALHNGVPVTLGDVATVAMAPEPAVSGATIDGKPGVLLMVGQQYGSNTLDVTRRAESVLADLRPALEARGFILWPDLFRPANFIVTATDAVELALLMGAVLVIVVLFIFLNDWRTALISCTAIPLSLLAAAVGLRWSGATLNTMTLGGLAIAIGEVVDDAVIDVENIVRRLRENRRASVPRPAAQVVLDASLEVRSAVVYATFAVILAFLPVLALSGLAGRLFAPLAAAYVLAVLASLVVALTLTPAMAGILLLGRGGDGRDPPVASFACRHYERLVRRIVPHSQPVLAATTGLTLAAAATLPLFGTTFLPNLKEGHFVLHTTTAPGTSLVESLRLGSLVSQALLQLPSVRSVGQHVGRAELADETSGTHESEFEVELKQGLGGEEQEQAEDDIRRAVATIPGVTASLNTFLTERVEETLSGTTALVAIEVYGNDLDNIDQAATAIADVVDDVPGAADVHVQAPPGVPVLSIQLDGLALERFGFTSLEVLDAIRTAFRGDVVGQARRGERVMNVLTVLGPADRSNPETVGDLPLRNASGQFVRLRDLARIEKTSGRYEVLHKGAERIQTVAVNVRGRNVGSFVAAAKARVAAKANLPPDVSIVYAGAAKAQAAARRDLLVNATIATGGIVLVLAMITRRWRNLALIVANLPFALIGGVAAALATGGVLSLGSTVGFVTLFGITLRNSIMMLSHYQHLVEVEGRVWGLGTAVEGAVDRLVPIVMTTLVTMLGLLPLALTLNEPGREIQGPMAVVILGGLLTSMVLNLVVLPTLALRFGQFESFPDEFRDIFRGHGIVRP